MSCGIYRYTNIINGKRYIGQSVDIEGRYKHHIRSSKEDIPKTLIDKAIAKYGLANFRFEILEYCSKEELDEREIYWINYYYTFLLRKDGLGYGYNMSEGGSFGSEPYNKGKHLSEEQKKKISISCSFYKGTLHSQYGRHKSDDTKQKLRNANLGKKQSKETIEKRRKKLTGIVKSDEFKQRMSNDKKSRKPVWKNDLQKYVKEELFDDYINNGWIHGINPVLIKKREETKKKQRLVYQ